MAALLSSAAIAAPAWRVIKHQGRDYVTFANVAEFYQFPEYSQANRTVSLRSERRGIRAQAGAKQLYINGVRFLTNFPIAHSDGETLISASDVTRIIEPVLRPSRIPDTQKIETVVLDPGHGGTDQGSENRWGSEKQFTLDVALSAREELTRAGFKVVMTRSSDIGVSLEDRVAFANRFTKAVFISIHFNSSSGGTGVESYALAAHGAAPAHASSANHLSDTDVQATQPNTHEGHNIALTAAIHAAVLSRISSFDRGVRHARFHVLRNVKIPAVLIEGGFLSHPEEGQRIATPYYRQRLGAGIAQGVQNYNAAVNYRSPGASIAAVKVNLPPHKWPISEPLRANTPVEPAPPHPPSISISGGE